MLLLLTLGISVALAEGVLRAARTRVFRMNLPNLLAFHPELGWTFQPGATFPSRRPPLAFNRLGFRGDEHPTAKPPSVHRMVVLGDSFAAGTQVVLADTFAGRLEGLLNDEDAEDWEAINLGVNGYGTGQQLIALELYGLAWDPDLVVLQVFANDVCNNAIEAADYCAFNNGMRPYFVDTSGSLRRTTSQPLRNHLRRRLRTYTLLENAWMQVRIRARSGWLEPPTTAKRFKLVREAQQARARQDFGTELQPFLYVYAAKDEQIAPVAAGWRMTERLIETLSELLQARGIPLLAVVIPLEAAVDETRWLASLAAGSGGGPKLIRDYPEQRLGRLFDRLGVAAVMMLPTFAEHRDRVLPYLRQHLNREGHLLTAEAIHALMKREGMRP